MDYEIVEWFHLAWICHGILWTTGMIKYGTFMTTWVISELNIVIQFLLPKKIGYLIIVYCQTTFLIHYTQSREMPANKSCLYLFLIIRLPDFIAVSLIRGSSITSDICRGPYNDVCLDQFWKRYSRMQSFSYNSILKVMFIQNMIIVPHVQNAKKFVAQSLLEGLLVGKKSKIFAFLRHYL
jgi:hypothetical protein